MRLYLDLRKALPSVSVTGMDTKDEDREILEHKASYTKRPVGAASGHEASHDDPDKGGKYGGGTTVADEVEAERNAKAKKQGKKLSPVNKSEDDAEDEKDADADAEEVLKSLRQDLSAMYGSFTPSELEEEFLVREMGLPADEVAKGLHLITGPDRDRFNEWVCDRMRKSIDFLLRCV